MELDMEEKIITEKIIEKDIKSDKKISTLYFTFKLGSDLYGFDVSSVLEIMEYDKIFKTPGVSKNIRGLINLRGDVVPVVDLYARFFDKENKILDSTSIVILEINDSNELIKIGVLIDSVEAVVDIYDNQIENKPDIGLKIKSDFVSKIGKVDNQFVILLNTSNILNVDELSTL